MMQVKVQGTRGRSGSKVFHFVSDHNSDGNQTVTKSVSFRAE